MFFQSIEAASAEETYPFAAYREAADLEEAFIKQSEPSCRKTIRGA
jgi:hypothetical protein